MAGCLTTTDAAEPSTGPAPPTTEPSTATDTASTSTTPMESLETWLADANGYDGTPKRFGAGVQPTITVGEPVGDALAFDPPVIHVRPMTNVRWDWTGHGDEHNVVAVDGTFDSGTPNAQSGTSYHYIFEEPGVYQFISEPDQDAGMKGAVIVEEVPSTGYPAVDDWVARAPNFTGDVVDRTDTDTATVTVGAPDTNNPFVFTPPVLKIASGTTVEWQWAGSGPHTVTFEDHDIGTDGVVSTSGVQFTQTFAESGTYRYRCDPHETLGMRGAIIVE
ncbi:halocyanin domain-containing protein (plasmid) [Halobellus limi]|nr:halocyanin domain-containing protein [Halobellus limi]